MFRHVGIVVNNIDKMIWFYRDILCLEIMYDEVEKGYFLNHILNSKNLSPRIIKLGFDNKTIVELLLFNKKIKKNKTLFQNGYTHFAITVKNVDELYKKFINNNMPVINKPITSEESKVRVFFGIDPENNIIEFVELL
jgi:catechol 2,3-dioxygenase-like lactoylglutathione lyase family enzyme